MAVKRFQPRSPSRRQMSVLKFRDLLSGDRPTKKLTSGFRRSQGRNSFGRITTRHKGGGHKRRYRDLDFLYAKRDISAKVETIEYDPNRSGFIGLVLYADGARAYHLLPAGVRVGDQIIAAEKAEPRPGNRLSLAHIPIGAQVYNLESQPGSGARLVRSAGVFAEVLSNDAGYVSVRLPSSEVRRLPESCWASIGAVSNDEHRLVNYGKAGRSRWKGIRPTVRGTAMNPVDHPHGGGEGRQGRGHRRQRTMWGKPAGKGQKTRRAKKYSNHLIVSRRTPKRKNK